MYQGCLRTKAIKKRPAKNACMSKETAKEDNLLQSRVNFSNSVIHVGLTFDHFTTDELNIEAQTSQLSH